MTTLSIREADTSGAEHQPRARRPPAQLKRLIAIDELLTRDNLDIRSAVQRHCRDRLLPHVAQWFEDGVIEDVRGVARELGDLGVLGMHLDGYGCAGVTAIDYGLACLELEAVDSGLRSLVSVQGSLAMFAVHHWGSEDQKQRWLPGMARGELIGCFGLTEPDHGSDPGSMRTRARRDSGDWILTGRKMWITNGSIANMAIVLGPNRGGDPRVRRPDDTRDSAHPRSNTRCRSGPL